MRLYLFDKPIKSLYFCSSVVSLLFMRFHFKLGHTKIALSTAMISYSRLLAVIYQLNGIYCISNFRLHFIHSAQAGYEEFARESKPIRILSLSTVPSNTGLSTASFLPIQVKRDSEEKNIFCGQMLQKTVVQKQNYKC